MLRACGAHVQISREGRKPESENERLPLVNGEPHIVALDTQGVIMWQFFFIFFISLALGGAAYLVTRVHRFTLLRRLAERHRALSWLLSVAAVALLGLFALINVWTVVVVLLHLMVAWMLCDLAAFIVRKARRASDGEKRFDAQGVAALALCAVYLGVGWYNAHHVSIAEYKVETSKNVGSLRIVEIADCHIGMTLDGDGFSREVERVNSLEPDVAVIVGDFVDDDTKKDDMLACCRALGELQTKYGVYFVFGNHDEGYYAYRDFTSAELRSALAENGVVILEDESVLVDGRFYVVGRKDRSSRSRADAQSLTASLDGEKYTIMLDHQPNDYDAEAESGADLVLSGHTHGGHMIPAGWIGMAMGANDRVYGTETRGATTFIVTSGISGWAIPFKTGTHSEIVVIDAAGS